MKKEYENYNAMMEEVSRWYQNIVNASKFDNSLDGIVGRCLVDYFDYEVEDAEKLILRLNNHSLIYEELFNYFRTKSMNREDGNKTVVNGYTASDISEKLNLSPLDAYIKLMDVEDGLSIPHHILVILSQVESC